MKKAADTSTSL